MSGRLIITTKKSYCPWNAANVDRVLRDERLERERIQKLQKEEEQSRKRRQHDGDDLQQQQHVNLFPEAQINHVNSNTEKSNNVGVLPVPLGGEESNNRENGRVPFYLQNQSQQKEGTYFNNNHHGIHKNRASSSDQITNAIMRDQFASREERRKQRDDPMNRFYVDSNDAAIGNKYARGEYSSRIEDGLQSNYNLESSNRMAYSKERRKSTYDKEHESKKRKIKGTGDDDRSEASSCSILSSQSSGSSSHDYKRRKSKMRRDKKRSKRSKHSHHSKRTKKRRHKDKKRKNYRRRNSEDES